MNCYTICFLFVYTHLKKNYRFIEIMVIGYNAKNHEHSPSFYISEIVGLARNKQGKKFFLSLSPVVFSPILNQIEIGALFNESCHNLNEAVLL